MKSVYRSEPGLRKAIRLLSAAGVVTSLLAAPNAFAQAAYDEEDWYDQEVYDTYYDESDYYGDAYDGGDYYVDDEEWYEVGQWFDDDDYSVEAGEGEWWDDDTYYNDQAYADDAEWLDGEGWYNDNEYGYYNDDWNGGNAYVDDYWYDESLYEVGYGDDYYDDDVYYDDYYASPYDYDYYTDDWYEDNADFDAWTDDWDW